MKIKEIIKKHTMALAAMAIAVGSLTVMSFGKQDENNRLNNYFYELDSSGDIVRELEGNLPDCEEPSGTYCSVELSGEKPEEMTNISQALTSPLYVATHYKD